MKKRLFALLLALCLALTLLPAASLAEEYADCADCGHDHAEEIAEPAPVALEGETAESPEEEFVPVPLDGEGAEEIPAEQCLCDSEGHKWSGGVCSCCGTLCSHGTSDLSYIDSDTGNCTVCGEHVHLWFGGECVFCQTPCSHKWVNYDGVYVCDICDCACDHCDSEGDPSWINGVCSICGKPCDHSEYDSDTHCCVECGMACAHKNADGSSAWVEDSDGDCAVCALCGDAHTHSCSSEVTKEPTCIADGTRTWTCSVCGDTYALLIPATGEHSYSSEVTTAPTCGVKGVRTYTCSGCGDTYTEKIPVTGEHDLRYNVIREASCTTDGERDVTCSGCDLLYLEVIPATGEHNYVSTVTQKLGCTTDGVTTYTCSACGDTYTETVTATGHSYSSKVTKAATCSTEGVRSYTCSACGDTYTEAIAATGHSYAAAVTTEATCTADGLRTYTCSACGNSYTEAIAATGHDWQGSWTAIADKDGFTGYNYSCATCGESYSVATAASEGGNSRAAENAVTLLRDSADDDENTGITVKGTLLPDGGTAYLVTQSADAQNARGVAIASDAGDIRYLGYAWQNEDGEVSEMLQVTSEAGLESLSIDCESTGESARSITVAENGETLEIADVSVRAQEGGLVVTVVGESGSCVEYLLPAEAEAEEFASLSELIEQAADGETSHRLAGDYDTDGYSVSYYDLGGLSDEEWQELLDALYAETDGSTTVLMGGSGIVVIRLAETEETGALALAGGDDWADIAYETESLAEPEPTYVEVVFGTKTMEDPTPTPEPTIAPVAATSVPTIAAAPEATPRIIQKFNDATATPAPTDTPEPTDDGSFQEHLVNVSFYKCTKCGKEFDDYYAGREHEKNCGNDCVPSGTMITLADGRQKAIEDLTADDTLLVFDHESGSITTAGINFIENLGEAEWRILNLVFSDGSVTRLIAEHGYFDLDEMRYVYLREDNAADYIGHRFYKSEIVNGDYVAAEATLVEAYVTEEITGCWETVSTYHLDHFADGFLSMPGFCEGFFNFFDYDENLAYDREAMTADIERYGLFEYESVAEYMSYEEFASYPAQYLAVSIGKGLIDEERILEMIELYVQPYRE